MGVRHDRGSGDGTIGGGSEDTVQCAIGSLRRLLRHAQVTASRAAVANTQLPMLLACRRRLRAADVQLERALIEAEMASNTPITSETR